MKRLFFLLLLIPLAVAYDEQLTLYSVATPDTVLSPGAGFEVGSTLGNRTMLGAAMEVTNLQPENRELRLRLDGRLLYSSELNTHWYPQASVQWQLQQNRMSPWLGVGFQRQFNDQFGLIGETLWSPGSWDFQLRLGIRIWLMRFQSLDARVHQADPQGAVYMGGARPVSNTVAIVETQAENLTSVASSAQTTTVAKAESLVPDNRWYVNLGVFRFQSSMAELEQDARLQPYRAVMTEWLDSEKDVYRLLIGPYDTERAHTVSEQLTQQGLDNFLFQK